jgi:uncharacterized membrane protein SpoIIM required for sporulation
LFAVNISFVVKSNCYGHLAQLARASRLHREGRGFESLSAHHNMYISTIMKCFLVSLLFLILATFSAHPLQAQVIESTYVREGQAQTEQVDEGEVLGELDEDMPEVFGEFGTTNEIIDTLAVLGGIVLVALVVYIVYLNQERE